MTTAATTYDRAFFEQQRRAPQHSAARIVPLILDVLDVHSAVDVGCGEGSWLAECRRRGVDEVLGLDGGAVPEELLKIPADRFRSCDLGRHFGVERRFDLAISLEVAEHLPPARAAGFVDDLCALADHVLFSAAIPFQRGVHHVNCQWPDYWQALFAARGYAAFDIVRPAVWDDEAVAWWYRQNTLLYVRRTRVAELPALAARAAEAERPVRRLVHPDLCAGFDGFSLRELLGMVPAAARRALERRVHGSAQFAVHS